MPFYQRARDQINTVNIMFVLIANSEHNSNLGIERLDEND